MARKPIEIPIASETKAFAQGMETGVIRPIEDAEKALTELGRNRGPDQLERALEDAQDETKDLRRETQRTADGIEDDYRRAYRRAKSEADTGLGGMKGAAQEVTQEVGQNLGEAVSSVRGNLSDLGQVGQDTLGGLAATLASTGPAGIAGAAALAAGAVGLGLVTAELTNQQEAAERLRERLAGAYREAAEEGRNYINAAQIAAEANDLLFNPERADEYKQLREDAKTLALDESVLIAASTGSLSDNLVVQERIKAVLESQDSYYTTIKDGIELMRPEIEGLRDRWAATSEQSREYADRVRELDEITSQLHSNERDQIQRTRDADQARYEAMAALYSRPISVPFVPDDSAIHDWQPPRKNVVVNATVGRVTWE